MNLPIITTNSGAMRQKKRAKLGFSSDNRDEGMQTDAGVVALDPHQGLTCRCHQLW